MIKIAPILRFDNGKCSEALEFYREAFNAEILCVMYNNDANPEDKVYDERVKGLVYHAEMKIGSQRFMFNDKEVISGEQRNKAMNNEWDSKIQLLFDSVEEAKRVFSYLRKGGTIIYPEEKTTYADYQVTLRDRYGFVWGIMKES